MEREAKTVKVPAKKSRVGALTARQRSRKGWCSCVSLFLQGGVLLLLQGTPLTRAIFLKLGAGFLVLHSSIGRYVLHSSRAQLLILLLGVPLTGAII